MKTSGFQHQVATEGWSAGSAQRLAWPAAVLVIAGISLLGWVLLGVVAKLLLG